MGTISEKLTYLAETKSAIKEAIVAKGVEIADSDSFRSFADKIASIETGGGGGGTAWTGHADVEGLRAIGWTDDDIAYYQANGVNWNEEDDQYHLVTDDNKALYGVLTASNIRSYKERIVYLPKIDTSSSTSMYQMFNGFNSLVAIPLLDTSKVNDMRQMFSQCYSLVSIPQLDTSRVTLMESMFYYCYSLVTIPLLNTGSVTSMNNMFQSCYSLVSIPQLDTSRVGNMGSMFYNCYSLDTLPLLNTGSVTNMNNMFYSCYSLDAIPQLDTSNVTNMYMMFYNCHSLASIPRLNISSVTNMSNMFYYCYSLTYANIGGITLALDLSRASKLTKESLLYIINNEAATSAITIKLQSYAYTRLAEDADVVAALANHPNITLSR